MSTKIALNKRLGIVQCMEFLVFGFLCGDRQQHLSMCRDIFNIILSFFDGVLNWKLSGDSLRAFLNTPSVHLVSKSFMCDGLEFICHLIQHNKCIGFYWSIQNFPTNHTAIQVRYQLQCQATDIFWHFRSVSVDSERTELYLSAIRCDGNGWPFDCTLHTDDIKKKIKCLDFTCFITHWSPLEIGQLHRYTGSADRYFLKNCLD
eukprot:324680_1